MSRNIHLVTIAVVGLLLVGVTGPVLAHGWQTEVAVGDMELGVSSTPEEPIAGFETEFAARIADETPDDSEDRLGWGGVTNRTVEVHINGPGHVHDHVSAEIPEDDAHFHWSYRYPTEGEYTMTVVSEIEGEEYAFEFTRNVSLLPTEPSGAVTENITSDVSSINASITHMGEELHEATEKIDSLESKIDSLESKVDSLESDHEELDSGSDGAETSAEEVGTAQEEVQTEPVEDEASAGLGAPVIAIAVGLVVLGAVLGAFFWRRD